MSLEHRAGALVDDGSDIRRQQRGVAQHHFVHVAREEFQYPIRNLFLQEQDAQRRTALSGAVEGRLHHVGDHLLGQCGAVDQHRVLPAGLGNQRSDRARARSEATLDDASGLGRAREYDSGHPRVAYHPTAEP